MDYTFNASITPATAVRLLIMDELSLNCYWQTKQADLLLEALGSTSISKLLRIIDYIEPLKNVESWTLPQFGSLETLMRVPDIMVSTGLDGLSYTQLGFYLKGDIDATQGANTKYGETHGKGACQLGFARCQKNKVYFCALTNAFYGISSSSEKMRLCKLLCFRIPIVQTLLNAARSGLTNGYTPMSQLKLSTKKRRAICVKMILRELYTLQDPELSRRIDNIYWDLEEGESINVEI